MNIDQKINSIADSTQEVTKVLYTAKTQLQAVAVAASRAVMMTA
jgi:hypothetical protein